MHDMIGGFFGLELPVYDNFPYTESPYCAYVNSGRAAFECLLRNMPRPTRLWVPRFICDTVLLAPKRLGIPVARYCCTPELAPILPAVEERELVLLVNYFGLTGSQVETAAKQLPGQCIVDATTALHTPPLPGVPTFYSPRKFCGVADGGIATAPWPLAQLPAESGTSAAHSLHLLQRIESGAQDALPASEQAEAALCAPPRCMSPLTRALLRSIDFHAAAAARQKNYTVLHHALRGLNRLSLPDAPPAAPMCYPFVSGIPGLRDTLIDAGVALPLYWPEVLENTGFNDIENRLVRQLLPLPLDQRYREDDMQRMIQLILG